VGSAVAGVRNWVYDLFGRRTGGPDSPDTAPAPPPPAAAEQPEITEAPLVPLENATPQAPPFVPGSYGNVPEAPDAAPAPQPGIVLDMPVQPGVVVPGPAQGNPPVFVETRP
jgi:penicillin-binding protein 1A